MDKNYVTWIRSYVPNIATGGAVLASDADNLKKRFLSWLVGALNEGADGGGGMWQLNFELAAKAGLEVNATRLKSLYFPAVTMPEEVVAWIEEGLVQVMK